MINSSLCLELLTVYCCYCEVIKTKIEKEKSEFVFVYMGFLKLVAVLFLSQ